MSGVKRPGEGQARVDAGPVQRAKGARDVHDKAFQRDAKQYIIAFLADTRYQGQVSMKRLNELSQKEFLSIFSFVLRLLEPGAKEAIPSSGDGIQYIVDTLRALGHPAVPAKSILAAISTPSTVATVIGLLAWLVARVEIEVLRRPDRAEAAELVDEPLYAEKAKGMLEALDGDTDGRQFDKLVEDSSQGAQREGEDEHHRIREEIEVYMRKCAEYESIGDLAVAEIEAREAAQQKVDGMLHDSRQFEVMAPEMQRKRKQLEARQEQAQQVIVAVEREIGELKRAVDAQPMARADADSLAAETERMRARLKDVQAESAAKQAEIEAAAATLQERRHALQRDTSDVNAALVALKLAPGDARHARAQDLRVSVNPSADDLEELLQGPAKGALRAALDERVKTARRGCAATQELLKAERARVESAASGARQLQARLPEVDAQLERLAVSLAAERAAIDAETDKLLADINSAEARMAAESEEQRRRRQEAAGDKATMLSTAAEERAALVGKLSGALSAVSANAHACMAERGALDELGQYALSKADELQAVRAKTLTRAHELITRFSAPRD